MAEFEDFCKDLKELVEKYEKNSTMIKVEQDAENDIVKIFGERIK